MFELGFLLLPGDTPMAPQTSLPEDVVRLNLTGRADEAQFAQNPLPVLTSMGVALAHLHRTRATGLAERTSGELAAALAALDEGASMPRPYDRMRRETVRAALAGGPPSSQPDVSTHGAPIVHNAVLRASVTTFDDTGDAGADPAERDLAIALRSIAETFAPEATRTFLDAYESAGGRLPDGPTLDWYAMLAAFR